MGSGIRKYLLYLSALARKARALDRYCLPRAFAGSRLAVVPLADSQAKMIVDLGDPIMSRVLLLSGRYEPHVTRVFRELVREDSVIVDIGANTGYFSVLGGALAPRGKVFAFEPDPGNYQRLMANVYLNGLQGRVIAANAAAGDKPSEILLTNLDSGNAGARLTVDDPARLESLFGKGFASLPVPCVVVDEHLGDQRVDVVKIDIEGYEPKAFAGMSRLLGRWKPAVLTEFSPGILLQIGGMKPEEFLDSLLGRGYRASVIEFGTGERLAMDGSAPVMEYWRRSGRDHLDLLLRAL